MEPRDRPRPGDEASPKTSQTAENVCRRCVGRGTVDGKKCPECEGTGTNTTIVGDA